MCMILHFTSHEITSTGMVHLIIMIFDMMMMMIFLSIVLNLATTQRNQPFGRKKSNSCVPRLLPTGIEASTEDSFSSPLAAIPMGSSFNQGMDTQKPEKI